MLVALLELSLLGVQGQCWFSRYDPIPVVGCILSVVIPSEHLLETLNPDAG